MAFGIWNRIIQVYCFHHLLVDPKILIRFWLISQMKWSSYFGRDILFSNRVRFDLHSSNLKSVYSNQSFELLIDGKILFLFLLLFCI